MSSLPVEPSSACPLGVGVALGVSLDGVATIGVLRPGVLRGVWLPGVRPLKIDERGVPSRLEPGVDRWVERMDFLPTIQGLLVVARSLRLRSRARFTASSANAWARASLFDGSGILKLGPSPSSSNGVAPTSPYVMIGVMSFGSMRGVPRSDTRPLLRHIHLHLPSAA